MRGVFLWSEANNIYFYITQAWIHLRVTGILGRCYSTATVTDIMSAKVKSKFTTSSSCQQLPIT
ncbi:hypothetical protein PAHAL_2G267000 [Panicum hallii]|uniref:Uncharacterized protein n=1 Tax=Panicum hallii TaxID=206008 RepID=A0A2T8KQK5_9POAL|nr:hypothetical protein PAHAL_2G267000 [Panicum hallii]